MSKDERVVCEAAKTYGIEAPNAVRWARLRAGITTQRQLSRLTGIHPSIINDLERGRRAINPKWAIQIAKVTGRDWKELMADE